MSIHAVSCDNCYVLIDSNKDKDCRVVDDLHNLSILCKECREGNNKSRLQE